ncbi:MAG: serpin family protein [Bacillota bacterium]|nr:MAG: serine protease [Bacillota bacterium]
MRRARTRRSRFILVAAALLAGSLLPGCGTAGLAAPPPRPDALSPALAEAADRFAIGLLQAVHEERPDQNLFLSPVSAQAVLSLTANGARGETQREMLAALGYGDMDIGAVNEAMRDVWGLTAHPGDKVELATAHSIWYHAQFELVPAFRQVAAEQYGAELFGTVFGRPEAAREINRWVARRTRDRIPGLIDRTFPDQRMVLVNALYFRGEWQEPFDPGATKPGPFHRMDGGTAQVPFMHRTGTFGYLAEEGLVGVRLPYGKGDLALYAFMPEEWDGFVEGLTPERLRGWMDAMAETRIRLAFPKVRLEDRHELKDPLTALGMGRAFDPDRADFSGLLVTPEPLYIDQVIQKTFLEIHEEGTEAAAATAVTMRAGSAPPSALPEVVLDRPFLLAIRDDRAGLTLFMGLILDPS